MNEILTNVQVLDKDIDNILVDSKKEEDIIFYHNGYANLVKLDYPAKSAPLQFAFLDYDIDVEDDKLYLDEKEIENIKTYHVLNVLKPKVELYLSYKDIQFNCTFMRNLYSYAEEIGFENTIGYLLPLIQDLSYQKNKKNNNIFIAFLENFEKILLFFKKFDTNHSIIIKKLLPILTQILFSKKDVTLLLKAVEAIKFLIDNITKEECLNNVIPILIEMGNNEQNEVGQSISIQIFSEKASNLGGEVLELYVLPMFQSFSENLNDNIRKFCLKYMIPLFENMSYDIIQTKFVTIFSNFAKDKNLELRQFCCNMLPLICKTIQNNNNNYDMQKNIKKEILIGKNILDIFYSFANDPREKIQNNALDIFGEFIPYLDQETISSNPKLLNFYIDRVKNILNLSKNKKGEGKSLYKISFSFSSILLTYYKKIKDENIKLNNWQQLKPIYLDFITNKEFRIKNCIAAAFGEVSTILNQKILETELSPIILEMYNSNGAKLKNTIINIIPQYLTNINDAKVKIDFLNIYKKGFQSIKGGLNWREKVKFVGGVKKMINLFDEKTLFENLVSMLIEFSFDACNKLRIKSVKALSHFLYKFLITENEFKNNTIIILYNFATCSNYHYRQLFVYLYKQILKDEKVFEEFLVDYLKDLCYDKVFNVRYTVGKFLGGILSGKKIEKYEWIKKNKNMSEIFYKLKNDKELDVRKTVEKIEFNFDCINNIKDEIVKDKNVNIKFINNFSEFKNIFKFEPKLGTSWIGKDKKNEKK